MKTYTFFNDPGHGWLEVPRSELPPGFTPSEYSYQRGDLVYLEEDCDAPPFIIHHKLKPIQLEEHHTDDECFVRSLERFTCYS